MLEGFMPLEQATPNNYSFSSVTAGLSLDGWATLCFLRDYTGMSDNEIIYTAMEALYDKYISEGDVIAN